MLVKLRYSVKGYGYFAGDTAELADDEAAELVEQGAAIIVQETEGEEDRNELPEDLPMRALLWENGYVSVEQILDARETLLDVKGIGEASAARIVEYCEEAVEAKLQDALREGASEEAESAKED